MGKTWCLTCGQPTNQSRCPTCTAAMYDGQHQAERRRWEPAVDAGRVTCRRCHQPIQPGQAWDLGHPAPRHPEHARCNRSAQ